MDQQEDIIHKVKFSGEHDLGSGHVAMRVEVCGAAVMNRSTSTYGALCPRYRPRIWPLALEVVGA